jgi:hypothetical protein
MPTLFMETTRIAADRTVSEVQSILMRHGAKAILLEYENNQISALSFQYVVGETVIPFRLPCRWQAMEAMFKQSGKRPRYDDTYETWSRRVAWRQILRWVEAQMALVETNMVMVQEVFFPYIQTKSGQTLYEIQEQKQFALLGPGK